MQLEGFKLSEISQKEKDKHHIISLICGTLPLLPERKKKKNKFKFTDTKTNRWLSVVDDGMGAMG